LNLLVVSHGLWYGGAQVSTIELLRLIRGYVDVRVVACQDADKSFVKDLLDLGIFVDFVPYRLVAGYPDMAVEFVSEHVERADIVWISDVCYLAAPKIKRIKDVPVVAHLRSYALICPWWGACFGLRGICSKKCSSWRIIRCKRGFNGVLHELGVLSRWRSETYRLLDFVKGPIGYSRWPMHNGNIVESVDGFISVSKATKELHLTHWPELRDKPFEVIYNPIGFYGDYLSRDVDGAEVKAAVSYFGMDNPAKGPHVLIFALKKLLDEGYSARMIMVGCKGSWIEKLASKLGVHKLVTFLGKVPRSQVYNIMRSSSAVAVPSIWPEPLPRVALEANLLGVPVLASKFGGVPEVVEDGVTGFIVDPLDPASVSEGLRKISEANFSSERIRAITLDKFCDEKAAHKFLEFISKIAQR